jgi:asparaginyl-tRNA synthetase
MYELTSISAILSDKVETGKKITVRGWVQTRRDSKAGFSFVMLNDGSCLRSLQIVASNALPNYQQTVLSLTVGCSVIVHGDIVASQGKEQSVELKAEVIEWVGGVEDPETYPMSAKHHTLEYLRQHLHLRPRTHIIGAVTRVQHCVAAAVHRFFYERGFYWIHTPIITGSDCEGAGEAFRVSAFDFDRIPMSEQNGPNFERDFFGKEAFLTVSGQLHAESYCEALSKVYTFGPTFRAEKSETSRHLAEFWMIEPEVAFADLMDITLLAEELLKYVFRAVLAECSDDMQFFAEQVEKDGVTRLKKIVEQPFVRMEYGEVVERLKAANQPFEFPVEWGVDLQSEHERYLVEQIVGQPVIVMNYPAAIKAFYMRMNDDQKTVAAMDVLAPGIGEIIGGSQREERYDRLKQRLDVAGLDPSIYDWYLDLRRYGSVPHSGFGIGFERLISYITGMKNLRDIIPFPRARKQLSY